MKIRLFPTRNKILIFDQKTGTTFFKIFDSKFVTSLAVRKEEVFFSMLVKSVFEKLFILRTEKLKIIYFKNIVNYVEPILCVTNQDILSSFYSIQQYCKKTVFFSFQQGLRDKQTAELNNVHGNYVCFNSSYKKMLKKRFPHANILCGGSIKANFYIKKQLHKKQLAVVSNITSLPITKNIFKSFCFGEIVFSSNYFVQSVLKKLIRKKKIRLKIISRSFRETNLKDKSIILRAERKYYSNIYGNNIEICTIDPYQACLECDLIVSDNSTLGYEAFGMGCKVFFAHVTSYFMREPSYKFGWPGRLANRGPFWCNEPDKQYMENRICTLYNMPFSQWKKLSKPYQEKIMVHNFGNHKIVDDLKTSIPDLEKYCKN